MPYPSNVFNYSILTYFSKRYVTVLKATLINTVFTQLILLNYSTYLFNYTDLIILSAFFFLIFTIKDNMPSGFPGSDPTPSAFFPTGTDEPEDECLGNLQDDTEITVNRSVNTYLISYIKLFSNELIQQMYEFKNVKNIIQTK